MKILTRNPNFSLIRGKSDRLLVQIEVTAPDQRSNPGPKNSVIVERWTELIGEIPEATKFRTYSESTLKKGVEYDQEALNLELRGPSSEDKAEVAEKIRELPVLRQF